MHDMKHLVLWFAVGGLIMTDGCAWYNITPISKAEADNWATGHPKNGYIIYQPELYFAASITATTTTNADKTLQVKQDVTVTPIYLPNPAKAYRVSTHNILAKADFTFNFGNGWELTSIADKSDNTTIANTLAGQLQTMLSAAKVLGYEGDSSITNRVLLYKPEYDTNGIITGFKPKVDLGLNKP
jgi:hypothetical protein